MSFPPLLAFAALALGGSVEAQTAAPPLPAMAEVRAALAEAGPRKAHVWLSLREGSGRELLLEDPFLGIRVTGVTTDGEAYRFRGTMERASFSAEVRPDPIQRDVYRVEGAGARAVLKRLPGWEKRWSFAGAVEAGGDRQEFSLALEDRPYHDAWFIEGPGVELKAQRRQRRELTGSIETERFGKKALTVLAAAVSVMSKKTDERRERTPER